MSFHCPGFKLTLDEFNIPPSPSPFNYDIFLSMLCIDCAYAETYDQIIMNIYHFPIYATCPMHLIPSDLTAFRLCDDEWKQVTRKTWTLQPL